jgi:hypothetical protein
LEEADQVFLEGNRLMLYDVNADTGEMEHVDLDNDGVFETRRPKILILTVEAASGDEAAAKAMALGAKFVRGVSPSSQQRTPEPAAPDDRADLTAAADELVIPHSAATDLLARADSMPFLSFKSLAAKILGPDAPGTKAEIIAALYAKAA